MIIRKCNEAQNTNAVRKKSERNVPMQDTAAESKSPFVTRSYEKWSPRNLTLFCQFSFYDKSTYNPMYI